MGKNRITPVTLRYMLINAGFWMSFCLVTTYAAVFLQGIGFSNSELGVVVALGNVGSALLSTFLGSLIDRNPRVRHVSVLNALAAVQAAMMLLLAFHSGRDLISAAAYVIYMSTLLAVNAVNLDISVRELQAGLPLNFGLARSTGSLGFMLLSVPLGMLVEARSHTVLIWTGLGMAAIQVIGSLTVNRDMKEAERQNGQREGKKEQSASLNGFIRENGRFCLMLLGATVFFVAHNLDGSFLINEIRALGGDESTMGWIASFQALVEVPVMAFSAWLLTRGTYARWLKMSFLFFVLKMLAYALSPNIPVFFAARLLQAPSYALFIVMSTPYAGQAVAAKDSAKAQSLLASAAYVGCVVAGLAGGVMFDTFGVRTTMLIAAAIAAAGAGIAWAGVTEKKAEAGLPRIGKP